MNPGYEYALVAMICLGLADLVYKRGAAAGVQAHQFLMVQAWCFAPAVTLYGVITGTLELEMATLWGMGTGLFVFVALYNFARSLKSGSVSIVAPIFRLNFTVTAVLAVLLLGEPLTAYKLAGIALALAAVWLLLGPFQLFVARSGTFESPSQASQSSTGKEVGTALGAEAGAAPVAGVARLPLVQAVIAMAAMGVANLFYKLGALTGGSPATFIAGQAATFLPLATGFAWSVDRGLRTTRAGWVHSGTAAALFLLALVMLFESLARGEASALVPISQMGFVVTAAFGLVFLREPFTLRKSAGLAFAVAALVCLAKS
jgi:drug/metabolite transporter (DMT)-like permease